ncbi:MAG: hypothetical protein ACOC5K_01105 [Chloroflexota bacterium]
MRLTHSGMKGVADYFADAIKGDPDVGEARQALAQIDQARAHWAEARTFQQ